MMLDCAMKATIISNCTLFSDLHSFVQTTITRIRTKIQDSCYDLKPYLSSVCWLLIATCMSPPSQPKKFTPWKYPPFFFLSDSQNSKKNTDRNNRSFSFTNWACHRCTLLTEVTQRMYVCTVLHSEITDVSSSYLIVRACGQQPKTAAKSEKNTDHNSFTTWSCQMHSTTLCRHVQVANVSVRIRCRPLYHLGSDRDSYWLSNYLEIYLTI